MFFCFKYSKLQSFKTPPELLFVANTRFRWGLAFIADTVAVAGAGCMVSVYTAGVLLFPSCSVQSAVVCVQCLHGSACMGGLYAASVSAACTGRTFFLFPGEESAAG